MADTEFKKVTLVGLDPFAPTLGQIAPNTTSRWSPFRQVQAAQDATLGGTRRVIAKASMSGSVVFTQPEDAPATTGAGSQLHPDIDTYRSCGYLTCRQTPGSMLEAHILYVKSGHTQRLVDTSNEPAGAWGEVRLRCSWVGDASSGVIDFTATLEGDASQNGLPDVPAGMWQLLREKVIEDMRPPGFLLTNATAVDYSEEVDVTIEIQVRGGVRLVDLAIYEIPVQHVQEHDDTDPASAHGVGNILVVQTPKPQIEAADGTTYDERRFGTYQTIDVAARQEDSVVARLVHWTAFGEGKGGFESEDPPTVQITATSFRNIVNQLFTAYNANAPGWAIAASHCLPYRYNDSGLILRDEAAVVPVRIDCRAEWNDGGGTFGRVRFQTGLYEWIDIDFDTDATMQTRRAYGFLQSQVYPDHHAGLLNALAFVDASGDTLDIESFSIDLLE